MEINMLLLISDLHGSQQKHINICNHADSLKIPTLQIGDLGYNYNYLSKLNPVNHQFFGGNHENYNDINNWDHNIGDYGYNTHGDIKFFFVRGEFSIDKRYREKMHFSGLWPKTWFIEEEIKRTEHSKVLDMYKDYVESRLRHKSNIYMFSHGCPKVISDRVGRPEVLKSWGFDPDIFHTETQYLLDSLLDYHPPDLWVFGHYHRNYDAYYNTTRFVCIKEAGTFLVKDNIKDSDFYDYN